jgi:hypothetical protein
MQRRVGCYRHTQLKEGANWHFQPQNDVLMSLFLAPREAAVRWATGLSQNHNHTIATGAVSRSRPHKLLFHIHSNSVLLSTSPSPLILAGKPLPGSCMSWPFHSLSHHSLIKNLWRWNLKAQPSSFIHPNVISSQFLRVWSERPRYLFLPTNTRPVIGHNMMNSWLHVILPKCRQMTKREIISPAKRKV